jgi:manganese transport protein
VLALALLCSGLSSSCVGVLAGQVVMQGFLRRSIPLWVRRAVALVPPLIMIGLGMQPTEALVWSQVVLSFGIPFALVPLVVLTASRDVMGPLVNRSWTTAFAAGIAAVIIGLNVYLIGTLWWN